MVATYARRPAASRPFDVPDTKGSTRAAQHPRARCASRRRPSPIDCLLTNVATRMDWPLSGCAWPADPIAGAAAVDIKVLLTADDFKKWPYLQVSNPPCCG